MAVRVDEKENLSTLGEVLSRYSLEKKDLELKCPARVRLEIAEHLGDWKMAGRYLNIDPQKLDDIQVENHTEERRRVALLDAWDEKEGEGATYLKLAVVLNHRKRTDLVEKLCEKIIEKCGREDTNEVDSRIQVKQKLDLLEEEVKKLSSQLRHELEKKGIEVDDFLDEITQLPTALKRIYQKPIDKKIKLFRRKYKISQVFHQLINPITSFLDYKLLEHLIFKLGSSQLKQDMAAYVDAVNNFKRETTVAELMDLWDGIEDHSMNFTELQIRFGEDPMKCTLERLDKYRKRFCIRFKLTELVMILIHLKSGSFIAVLRYPSVLVGDMETDIQADDQFFYEENILSVSVAGKQIFLATLDRPTHLVIHSKQLSYAVANKHPLQNLPKQTMVIDEDQAKGLTKMSTRSWISFFGEVSGLIETSERQFGIASASLADHLTERFEIAIQSCTGILNCLNNPPSSVSLDNDEQAIVVSYKREIDELNGYLRVLLDQWKEYRMLLDSTSFGFSYRASVTHTGRRGRPRFDIDKEQLEYLLSVSFNWSEIAALLGVSRMTLYRHT